MTLGQQECTLDEGNLETTYFFIEINAFCHVRFLGATERFQPVLQFCDKEFQRPESGARNSWFYLKIAARSGGGWASGNLT
jgi:hypothetical protein